jgi:putative transposase
MDFVHDQLSDGRKIRVLTIVDTFSRLSPAIDVRQSYHGSDVVETLERVIREIGCPKTIRLDNGPEFVSRETRSMGLHARRHARLHPARQTDRQRIY